ncbi:MAG: hypothetical protein V4726_17495 [Verrucomicrobiota bacterium]
MSTIALMELKEQLHALSRPERQEVLAFLKEMEAREWEPAEATVQPRVSFEEAMDYTFTNFDNALRKLAQ